MLGLDVRVAFTGREIDVVDLHQLWQYAAELLADEVLDQGFAGVFGLDAMFGEDSVYKIGGGLEC